MQDRKVNVHRNMYFENCQIHILNSTCQQKGKTYFPLCSFKRHKQNPLLTMGFCVSQENFIWLAL